MSLTGASAAGGFDDQENPLDIGLNATGENSENDSENTVALGRDSVSGGRGTIAIGNGASAIRGSGVVPFRGGIAIGQNSNVEEGDSIAIGRRAESLAQDEIIIGVNASADGTGSRGIAIGGQTSNEGVAIGTGSLTRQQGVSVGFGISMTSDLGTTPSGNVAIGHSATTHNEDNVAIGARADASDAIAIGPDSQAGDDTDEFGALNAIAIGSQAVSTGSGSIAIGNTASIDANDATRIGTNVVVHGGLAGTYAPSNLNNSELYVEIDEANTQLVWNIKDSNGNTFTATLAYS